VAVDAAERNPERAH